MRVVLAVCLGFGLATMLPISKQAPREVHAADPPCGKNGKQQVRTTLYFGLSRTSGTISDDEWTAFLREEVTPRFPDGLTVWDADGQWRRADATIGRERAKVLLVVHDGRTKAQQSIGQLVDHYKQKFQQESVLWESAGVCAAF